MRTLAGIDREAGGAEIFLALQLVAAADRTETWRAASLDVARAAA